MVSAIDPSLFPSSSSSSFMIDLTSFQTLEKWLQVVQSYDLSPSKGLDVLKEHLSQFVKSSSSSSSQLIIQCDSVYDRYPQLLASLFYQFHHPTLSYEECCSQLQSCWKSFSGNHRSMYSNSNSNSRQHSSLGEWLDTSQVDLHLCKHSDKLPKYVFDSI